MASLADRVAQCALNHYHSVLPSNGGKPQKSEWTVYAAIVACRQHPNLKNNDAQEELWVVSCATGSKCTAIRPVVSSLPTHHTTQKQGRKRPHPDSSDEDNDHKICSCYNGMVLKDSHAETLARRGLVAVLWDEVENLLQNKPIPTPLLEAIPSSENRQQFQLRKDTSLHMYISDNPCGDGSIYRIKKPTSNTGTDQPETTINFTGAKIILTDDNGEGVAKLDESISSTLTCTNAGDSKHATSQIVTVGREDVQQLGALRLKSSRSNIPSHMRSMSMSCSDKLVRWGVLGLGGALLSMYIPNPIVLSSVCVSKDPRAVDDKADLGQLDALRRAITGRIGKALMMIAETEKGWNIKPPEVAVVSDTFENSKSSSEFRHDKRMIAVADNEPNSNKRVKKESVCGMSINWQTSVQHAANTEVTIGATGLKRGKKPKSPTDVVNSSSRLSRYQFALRCMKCNSLSSETGGHISDSSSYRKYKEAAANHLLSKVATSASGEGPLAGWVRSGSQDDFALPHKK